MDRKIKLCKRIMLAVFVNYDEILRGCEFPYISLLVDGFEIPERIKNLLHLPDNAFVDELLGDLEEVRDGEDCLLCFSVETEDGGSERVEEISIWELDEDYLERLAVYAENHIGSGFDVD